MRNTETPEQVARRCARELRASLRAAGRCYLRFGDTIDGLRLTLGARLADETLNISPDLPPELLVARPASRQVYRTIRDLREELGEGAGIWPADIVGRLDRDEPDTVHSADTVNHALRDLRDRELAWSHPARGWQLGRERPRLPFFAGQSDRPAAPAPRAYTSRVAGVVPADSRARAIMSRQACWVPGEKTEYGVVIADAGDEEKVIAVTERLGEMHVPTRSGRLCKTPAAKGELVRVEGNYAVVRFPGGHQVRTRVLGGWQLEGRTAPAPEEAVA